MTESAPNQEELEIKRLREVYKTKLERIKDCEDALRFYSNFTNYLVSLPGQSGLTYQNMIQDDFETADNDTNTLIAGRRAREYFKKYDKDNL